jgi:UDP-GlcNAc:undecaprenyl-phosphate GlcNAc-1-phosphate transferase
MFWTFGKWYLLLGTLLGVFMGKVCIDLATRLHWVDRPGHRKLHTKPVPYLGGLGVFSALVLSLVPLAFLGGLDSQPGFSLPCIVACLAPALGAMLLGLWDDVRDMPARLKFIGQGILALLFSTFAYRFNVIHVPGFPPFPLEPVVAIGLTTFFIVAVVNGFNMIDGSDALCLGVSITSLSTLSMLAIWKGQPHLMALSMSACGACLGLLYWNRPPARIYGGDAGSQGLGMLISCMVVAVGAGEPGQFFGDRLLPGDRQPFPFQIMVACLVIGLPALEVQLSVLRRGLQGRPLGRADQGHLHHRLNRLGIPAWGIALIAVTINLFCGAILVAALAGEKGLVVIVLMPFVAFMSFGLMKLGYARILQPSWLDDRRPHFAVAHHFTNMQIAKLKLSANREEALALVAQSCHEFGVHECRISLRDETYTHKLWTWTWLDPSPQFIPPRLQHKPLLNDRVRLSGTRNHASWNMINDDREAELTMNMRVLMVDFMSHALERLVDLRPTFTGGKERYSFELRGQKDLVLSIKGFKKRLQARRNR